MRRNTKEEVNDKHRENNIIENYVKKIFVLVTKLCPRAMIVPLGNNSNITVL